MAMASRSPPFFSLLLFTFMCSHVLICHAHLNTDYYKQSCPTMESVIQEAVINKQLVSPTTAAGTLRLFFHDCFAGGCDASLLVTANSFNKDAEREAEDNISLPGDAFDMVVRAKSALEIQCPGIVSCADILALATRDLVKMVGGPFYKVRLGRKDSFVSKASHVKDNLPSVTMSVSELIALFERKGFTAREMVALSGAHTIGFSHCNKFADRVFNYSRTEPVDPALNPKYAAALQTACMTYKKDPTMSVFNDVMSPGKFDNSYYQNLPKGLGLLATDSALYTDKRTRPIVELYAANQTTFFQDFAHAMEKLSIFQVKTGKKGEVRSKCDAFNSLNSQ